MKKLILTILIIGAVLILAINAISLIYGATVDTTKFKGQAIECDTLVGADTIIHVYQMFVSDITGDFTLTYWMSDSCKFRYWVTNSPSIGWFNVVLVDTTNLTADSASLYGSNDNMDIDPFLWTKWELIGWGHPSIIKYTLKDRLVK